MRKFSAILLALLLLVTLAVPAFAAENEFVPSISYKDGPELDKAEMNKEDVTACLVITSILQAKNKETDITQPERDLLLEIYEKLKSNEMTLPLEEDDFVVRELVDISWRYSECVEPNHRKDEWLSQPNNTVTVTLKTGIPKDMEVVVLVFVNEQWVKVSDVTRNPDKSITCVFEEIGPVAICVREKEAAPPQTGDAIGRLLWIWIVLLVVSLGALTALVLNRRKFLR